MDNPQKFNIINPKRGSCEALYEGVRMPPMWRRCLRYRPRAKDLRVLMLPVDRIHGMLRSVRRLWPPNPGDVHSKHQVSSSDTRTASKISTKSIKATQARGPEKNIAQDSVSPVKPTLTEPFDRFPPCAPIKESKSDEADGEPSIGTALSSGYDTHSEPQSSLTSPHPNRHICIASTTPRTTLNYSRPQRYIQDGNFQEKIDNAVLDNSRSNDTSSWKILQVNKHISRFKLQESTGAGLVDISMLVPDYPVPETKPATSQRLEDESQYQTLPRLSSAHTLTQALEVGVSRQEQEQEEIVGGRYPGWQESKTPRTSKRCGQVWDSEETRVIFLEIALTQGKVTRLT